jgi:hypothetical protein
VKRAIVIALVLFAGAAHAEPARWHVETGLVAGGLSSGGRSIGAIGLRWAAGVSIGLPRSLALRLAGTVDYMRGAGTNAAAIGGEAEVDAPVSPTWRLGGAVGVAYADGQDCPPCYDGVIVRAGPRLVIGNFAAGADALVVDGPLGRAVGGDAIVAVRGRPAALFLAVSGVAAVVVGGAVYLLLSSLGD